MDKTGAKFNIKSQNYNSKLKISGIELYAVTLYFEFCVL